MTGARRLVRQSQPPESAGALRLAVLEPRRLGMCKRLFQEY